MLWSKDSPLSNNILEDSSVAIRNKLSAILAGEFQDGVL